MPTTAADLKALELFENCTDDDLAVVSRAVDAVLEVPEGDVICAEDELADRWWIVVEGQADATSRGLYLGTILPGETIGELALLDGQPRTATVTATTDMVLYELEGKSFVDALLQAPNVAVALLRLFADPVAGHRQAAGALGNAAQDASAAPPRRGQRRAATGSSTRMSTAISRTRTPMSARCGSRQRCTGRRRSIRGW